MTTMEHISRYLIQLEDASIEEGHKVWFFPLSISGPAFSWFSSLEPNSITGWADLEKQVRRILLQWDRGEKAYRFDKHEAEKQ